jgi:putative aldouronate transport system permease protein
MALYRKQPELHLMILPGILLVLAFSYVPILGNIIAFKRYEPLTGILASPWAGLGNFRYVFKMPETLRAIRNTLVISSLKIVAGLVAPVVTALLLNELPGRWFRKSVQTAIYVPHFMSWIILGGIFIDLLSLRGVVNGALGLVGIKPIYFLGDNSSFTATLVATDTWKDLGFSTLIFLAALTSIDPTLYEAAGIDGASRWQQTWHVTLPGMRGIIVLIGTLSLGSILNAGFEQVLVLYSPQVYETGEILDTFVYSLGILQSQYGPATAVGLFKAVISCGLISLSYFLAYRFADYRIF